MQQQNQVKQLGFSDSYIDAKFVENVRDYYIPNYTITINPNIAEAYLDEPSRNLIPPLSSTILKNTRIEKAGSLILLEVKQDENVKNIVSEPGWDFYGNIIGDLPPPRDPNELQYPKDTPLWRSPQISLGSFKIDPYVMTRQAISPTQWQRFEIKVNLWFAPANTNCFIHNKHDFIEIHSQILGQGRMQKFKAQDYNTLYEDILMSPGYTTPIPFCEVRGDNQYTYPWHQYYADTDCIWLAIEYHPIDT
jgi:hypothetical protein